MLDINLAEEPLDIDSFSYLSDSDYPLCVLGFQLKNLYDQKRLVIKQEYNPVDVIHFVPGETAMPKFFRGIKINYNSKMDYLIKKIEALGSDNNSEINKNHYTQILNEHKLSCNNCFAFLRKGVYPIDSEHLQIFANTKLTQTELYSTVLEKTDASDFQSLGYFVIYILSNKNFYKTTTKNFLHTVVKKYTNY